MATGRVPTIERLQAQDDAVTRWADKLRSAMLPLLQNPANALAKWRINESASPQLFQIQYWNGTIWVTEVQIDQSGNLTLTGTLAGGGTVTSVAVAVPDHLTVSGTPITTSGTITLARASKSANVVAAGPTSGGAAAWNFRSLVSADIPNLDTSILTTGTLPIARGGLNGTDSPAAGATPYGDGTSWKAGGVGTSAQVWTSNGASAPTWQTSAGSSSGWLDAYTIDFTTQSTQNLITGGDGAKTIAGKTFYVVGTAGSTTFGITNGVGLVMTRNTVDPEMYVRLVDLNSAINPLHDDIEIWYYFTPALPVVNNNLAGFGHYKYATSPSTNYKAVLCYRIETGALVKRQLTQYAGVTTLSGTSNANTTDTVFIDRIYGPLTGATFSTLDSSGAFPSSWGAFNYMGSYQITSPNEVLGTGYANPSDVAAYWTASSGASKLTLLKMKVRVRQ